MKKYSNMVKHIMSVFLVIITILGTAMISSEAMSIKADAANPKIQYRSYVEGSGWQKIVSDGTISGTTGKSLRLQALEIGLSGISGDVYYGGYCKGVGWTKNYKNRQCCRNDKWRLEAVRITMRGEVTKYYDIKYRTHLQSKGWGKTCSNGEVSGSTTDGLRIEAIQIMLVRKKANVNLSTYSITKNYLDQSYKLNASMSDGSSSSFQYSSSNTSVAKVNNNGYISFVGQGDAVITVKASNGNSNTCKVHVNFGNQKAICNTSKLSVKRYNSTKYTVKSMDGSRWVQYSATNPRIVSVNTRTGQITGLNKGSAYVYAKLESGKTYKCLVTVK